MMICSPFTSKGLSLELESKLLLVLIENFDRVTKNLLSTIKNQREKIELKINKYKTD